MATSLWVRSASRPMRGGKLLWGLGRAGGWLGGVGREGGTKPVNRRCAPPETCRVHPADKQAAARTGRSEAPQTSKQEHRSEPPHKEQPTRPRTATGAHLPSGASSSDTSARSALLSPATPPCCGVGLERGRRPACKGQSLAVCVAVRPCGLAHYYSQNLQDPAGPHPPTQPGAPCPPARRAPPPAPCWHCPGSRDTPAP
jgi:hypothetical protein